MLVAVLVAVLVAAFALHSPDVTPRLPLPRATVWNRDGCSGANRSPALRWTAPPAGTRSFALTMFDPDAGAAGWWHWIVAGIPAGARSLPAGVASQRYRAGRNDFGTLGYGGPCPPPGPAHRYVFTLYALDTARIPVAALDGRRIRAALDGHVLASATLVSRYGR